ncbi:unnamed protein product [Cercopithifilaria johnstoni]|uniref:Uncharacterized protein n=1 Tax=Cercopithifilaria johnstoni TaxID=2874296 RepID=A0A8J2M539_9BILA|nr:unnamed protein product [Cercopithifilaria johnstoni]
MGKADPKFRTLFQSTLLQALRVEYAHPASNAKNITYYGNTNPMSSIIFREKVTKLCYAMGSVLGGAKKDGSKPNMEPSLQLTPSSLAIP